MGGGYSLRRLSSREGTLWRFQTASRHTVRARVDPRLTGTRTFFYIYMTLLGCLAEIVGSLSYGS